MNQEFKVGELIRVEWNPETDELKMVIEVTDPDFKKRVLNSKDLKDIITINGRDIMRIVKLGGK